MIKIIDDVRQQIFACVTLRKQKTAGTVLHNSSADAEQTTWPTFQLQKFRLTCIMPFTQ